MATTSRNLHLNRIYFNTPWFLELLAGFGLDIDATADERVLRRFLMGENTRHLEVKERLRVHDQTSIDMDDCEGVGIDDFFGNMQAQLVEPLTTRGISLDDVTRIELGQGTYEVVYTRLQNDAEHEARRRFAYLANMLEALRPQIYNRVDKAIAELGSIPQA